MLFPGYKELVREENFAELDALMARNRDVDGEFLQCSANYRNSVYGVD